MKRKEFLRKSIQAGVLPVVLNGMSIKAFAESPVASFLNKAGNEDRVLVLIQLNGGNDGLNTVIPKDQYSNLYAARPNITIEEGKILSLTGTSATGLHPSMTHLKDMYNNGLVSIIQSVGYPNQDYSHFRSTDIWLTGSNSDEFLDTGWMGRYLDTKFPGFPDGYPNTTNPDPPAIQIGALISPALQGENMSLGISITDPTNFYQFLNGTVDPAPNTPMGHELTFIRLVAQQTQQYSGSVKAAADKASNQSLLYPTSGSNSLADQLKIVARLVAGGLKTKVYMVSLGGFDTHAGQVGTTTDTGTHATLLGKISEAVNAFQDDLKLLGIDERVLGMTFSEFGRRIKSNDSLGTDHGAAAPLFVFGKKVIGGIYGTNPVIGTNPSPADNIAMQFDFRSVYSTLLQDWFGVSNPDLTTVLLRDFQTIPFLTRVSGTETINSTGKINLSNYPNPASDFTFIRFTSDGGYIQLALYDNQGKEISTLINGKINAGEQSIRVETNGLPDGMYYYRIQSGNFQATQKLTVQH